MQDTIMAGTVILKDDVRLPDGVKIQTESCAPGWKILKNMDGHGLDRAIREAGWNFCCLAHAIKISVIGSPGSRRMERGIKKFAARVNTGKFNALEITEVSAKSFLGVPYVNICARSRHVQQSMFLVPDVDVHAPLKKPGGTHFTPAPASLNEKRAVG